MTLRFIFGSAICELYIYATFPSRSVIHEMRWVSLFSTMHFIPLRYLSVILAAQSQHVLRCCLQRLDSTQTKASPAQVATKKAEIRMMTSIFNSVFGRFWRSYIPRHSRFFYFVDEVLRVMYN